LSERWRLLYLSPRDLAKSRLRLSMAAPPLGTPREAGVPPSNLTSYLLSFAKFQEEHPDLSPTECADRFSREVAAGHGALPFQGESVGSDVRTANHKIGSCPGGSLLSAPPPKSQRMSRSNSVNICLPGDQGCCALGTCICMLRGSVTQTSSYLGPAPTAQHTFALMSGRSPHQFQVSTSVTCRPNYHDTALPQKAPSLDDIQSEAFGMGSNGSLALDDYLRQQDRSEPFPLLGHSVSTNATGSCDDSVGGDYTLSIDRSLGVCAPRMQPQLSSSPTGCYTGGGESSHPMTRHSRSYSNASYRSRSSCLSSQGESTSPTDHFSYTQNSWAPMSRETSNASLTNGATMLRLSSSTGDSTTGSGGGSGDYDSFYGKGGMGAMLGLFAGEAELSSSLDKATGQYMLKRPPSTSVEDLDQTSAIEVAHEMQRNQSTASESVKPRKSKRMKEDAELTATQSEGVSTTIATGPGMIEKEEQKYQASRMEDSESLATCPNTTTAGKTAQPESGDGMGTTGNLPAGGRVLAASKPGKSGPKYAAVSATKPSYTRPPHPRVYCERCNESPDGFRGDHELRRHMEREHAPLRKMFVVKDISKDGQFLAKCKACQSGKKYGQDYNAAAHLRRQHFHQAGTDEKKKKGSFNTSSPDMAELRKWIKEVEVVVDDGGYPTEELQATDVSKAHNPRESFDKQSTSASEGEEEPTSQVSNSGSPDGFRGDHELRRHMEREHAPRPRVFCQQCNENPGGFRGDHELRRHMEREHAPRKMFVVKDISKDGQFLAKCEACQSGRKYGQDYNAAAHLMRYHFHQTGTDEKKKKGFFNTSSPGIAELRKWIKEVGVVDDGEYSTEPAVVAQHGALGVSDVPTQQTPFDIAAWGQPDNWYESGNVFDVSHNFGIHYSVSGGSMPLADVLNRQNTTTGGQDSMALPFIHLLQGGQGVQPSARGEAVNTIFGNLPGPAATKDTSGIFSNSSLAMMIPGPESIFEIDDLQFS